MSIRRNTCARSNKMVSCGNQARCEPAASFRAILSCEGVPPASRGLFEIGMGTLIVARGATPYSLTMAGFLLDTFALGVKDSFLISISGRELADYLDSISDLAPAEPVDPGYARKLLHDLVSWARTVGFAPHRDYPKLEPIFGSVAAASAPRFQFGHEGKPMLIGDMSDADEMLDGFDYEIIVDADELTELSE